VLGLPPPFFLHSSFPTVSTLVFPLPPASWLSFERLSDVYFPPSARAPNLRPYYDVLFSQFSSFPAYPFNRRALWESGDVWSVLLRSLRCCLACLSVFGAPATNYIRGANRKCFLACFFSFSPVFPLRLLRLVFFHGFLVHQGFPFISMSVGSVSFFSL